MRPELRKILLSFLIGILIALLAGFGYLYYTEQQAHKILKEKLTVEQATHSTMLSEKDAAIKDLESKVTDLTLKLEESTEEREELEDDLDDARDEVEEFGSQIKKIGSTVGTLEKLAKTDPELLMKYSKVYFLNEHYIPEKITKIDEKYSAVTGDLYLESRVYDQLTDMIEDAKDDGIDLKVRSAYRSFESQKNLKSAYSVTYGSGANAFSADQGYSEHQLGTTVDLTSIESSNQLAGFDTTEAYLWLQKNAHRFGFTLSYPKGNAYYIFEPWHWRYVGEDLAGDLHDEGKSFYDLDQRDIDKYLVSVFE